ncbi:MAG TPA: cytidylate kinase family protein [Streptosporangiaceae bacterium]|jgi:predicted cytidylate kinase|nr:cytidylate kinase family protein [Streptosporangiaceae bacterium]
MERPRTITINGDLGSGKSTVAIELANRLGRRRISMGDIYRQIAQQRGMTALQLNRHSERDLNVDAHVDRIQQDLALSDEAMIVDSRLGWHFFADAFKVHLVTDPTVAAQRVMARPADGVESYASIEEAKQHLHERSASERARFLARYHVDKARLRNYSLVCDTTRTRPEEVASHVVDAFERYAGGELSLLLDPRRLYPTEQIKNLRGAWEPAGDDLVRKVAATNVYDLPPIRVGYDGHRFFIIDGHRRASAALRANLTLIRAELAAEAEEIVVGDLTADEFFLAGVQLSSIYDWEAAHDITLSLPPHLRQKVQR